MSKLIELKGELINLKLRHTNFNESEARKVQEATEHFHEAINSPEFKEFMLNFSYEVQSCSGRWCWRKCSVTDRSEFKRNNGLSNEGVYNQLLTGEETLRPGVDREIDVDLELDRRYKRGVLGYTYSSSKSQWIYNSFFRNGEVHDVAGNIAHEWVHKMGYGHASKDNSTRKYTVPYAVGYFVRDYIRVKDR
jgi:hypothetical protein